jgi:hypothetical protein
VSEALHRRARQIRARAAVRAWQYRQRRHAQGTWFRLRRVLVEASEAWAIGAAAADGLIAEGLTPGPVGLELEPPKRMFFLSAGRLAAITDRRRLRVGLGAELLRERDIAPVPFPP